MPVTVQTHSALQTSPWGCSQSGEEEFVVWGGRKSKVTLVRHLLTVCVDEGQEPNVNP